MGGPPRSPILNTLCYNLSHETPLAVLRFPMLTIDNPNELLILERALFDLRFRPEPPHDPDLSRDVILSGIHRRVLDARHQLETDAKKQAKIEEFRNWRDDDFYRPCVERMIRECRIWSSLSNEHRFECVRSFLSPFDATESQIADLVAFGDDHHGDRGE